MPLKIRIIPTSLDLYTEMQSLRTSHFPPLQLTKHCRGCSRRNNSWLTLIRQTSQTDSDRGIGLPLPRLRWVSSKRNRWNHILPHRDQIQLLLSTYVQVLVDYNLSTYSFWAGQNWIDGLIQFEQSTLGISRHSFHLQRLYLWIRRTIRVISSVIGLPLPLM